MSIFEQNSFMKGMNYAGFDKDVFSSKPSDEAIDQLLATGVNFVAVNIFWYQEDGFSTNISAHPQKSVSDSSLEHLIKYLQDRGQAILLKPMVDALDHTWRGKFSPSSWDAWFESYEAFILRYAEIAENHSLDLFCVGCEFPVFDADQQAHWSRLIKKIRTRYNGPLTYAANFNKKASYRRVRFWDDLDFIGIDAYFSVSGRNKNSLKRMKKGWNRCIKKIERWHRRKGKGKGVLFTEIGATSVTGGARLPWVYNQTSEPNWKEQATYYEAFFHSFENRDWLKGCFWWWWDNPSTSDYIQSDNGDYAGFYTPKGKEAEQVLKQNYG